MTGLELDEAPRLGTVCLLNQVPDPAFRVAETGEGAQAFSVREQHSRAFYGLSLLKVRLVTGRFRAVEVNLRMGAVAERLGA